MKKPLFISCFLLCSLALSVPSAASAASQASRETIINKELDCVSRKLKNSPQIDWADVCLTHEETTRKRAVVLLKEDGSVIIQKEKMDVPEEEGALESEEEGAESYQGHLDALHKAHSRLDKGRTFEEIKEEHLEQNGMDLEEMHKDHSKLGRDRDFEDLAEENVQANVDLDQMRRDHIKITGDPALPELRQGDETKDESLAESYIEGDDLSEMEQSLMPAIYEFFDAGSPKTKFEISPQAFYSTYREPGFMRQEALMYGLGASYTYKTRQNSPVHSFRDFFLGNNSINIYRIELLGAYGKFDYESEGTGVDNGIPNYLAEGRGLLGYEFPTRYLVIMPFGGVGYRYLLDDGGGRITTTGHWGYDRESQYLYAPVGFSFQKEFFKGWHAHLILEYDVFIDGTQKSHLEDGGTGLDTLENDQAQGYGLRGSLKIFKRSSKIDFIFEPFVRYWDIEDSEASVVSAGGSVLPLAGIEPANNTTEYGVKISIRY